MKQSLDTCWEKDVAWVRPDECFVDRAERALPHAKALPTGCGATAQLRRLTLSRTSISRKRHESVMSLAASPSLDFDTYLGSGTLLVMDELVVGGSIKD